jgi:endo-1,4-beta-D-glucanase Y
MKKLQEDIDRNKTLMNIVNLSDLRDSDTWSPRTMVQKREGREKFYFEDNKFTKEPKSKSSQLYYLTPKIADFLNDKITETQEKYMEYLKSKTLTDNLIYDFTSDVIKYTREKKEGK